MDSRAVLREWLDEANPDRRGRQGRLLQGTSPERYEDDTAAWLQFIEETVRIGAWNATPSHIQTWLDMTGGAVRSRARRVSALSAFYAYAIHMGYARQNPAVAQLRGKPHDEPGLPQLTPAQMQLLLWAADRLTGPSVERDRVIVYLQLSGLLSRSITELDLAHLHFEQHRLTADVWRKGGGTRLEALPDEVRTVIREYLPVRRWVPPSSYEESGPLLTTYRGNRLDSEHTPAAVLRQAVAIAKDCPDPDAPELPARVVPEIVRLSPSPFKELEEARPADAK
ncbi:tyrosine-type recombinase/integrase [Streptomyces sp. NPDC059761]|uniref:tyrosine-type recombinase/integrase n=1 Tax=Streptomyces sp. NPDC059761 TaxID=3346937 RepID=UPI00364EC864